MFGRRVLRVRYSTFLSTDAATRDHVKAIAAQILIAAMLSLLPSSRSKERTVDKAGVVFFSS